MPTNTTNLSLKKPIVGADEDLWGGYINDNLDDLDSLLGGASPLALDAANTRVGVGVTPSHPFQVGTDDLIVDTSGNVLVGGTNVDPASANVDGTALGSSGYVSMTRDNGAVGLFNRKTSDGDILELFRNGGKVGSIGSYFGSAYVGSGDTALYFAPASDAILPFETVSLTGRDNAIDIGVSGARFKDAYLSGGVYLGGTGSSNYLDDYEYGFFAPTIGASGSDPTITYDGTVGNEGWYVKIGHLVFVQINIRTDSVSGGSGTIQIKGLPFLSSSLAGQGGQGTLTVGDSADWAGERPMGATMPEGVNYCIPFYRSTVTGNTIGSDVSDLGTGSNDNLIRISGTYYSTN